jgi:transcription initiation factor TFIID TATA-box-binding protein
VIGVSELDLEIQNVVACANLNQKIDLLDIMKFFINVKYRPRQFPGLVYRLNHPKTATLIFSSGKMVCTGAKSEKMARRAVRKVVKELKEGGIIILEDPRITIENMVGSADIFGEVDLEMAAAELDNIMYEPEMFPGMIYRMKDPRVVLLIFASGKIVITGGKSFKDVKKAVEKISALLRDEGFVIEHKV